MTATGFLVLLAGVLCGAVAIALIIRRSAAALRETEEMYRSAVDLSPDGIGITDQYGTLLFANAALARMIGAADASQVIGMKLSDFHHPDYQEAIQQRMAKLAESGRVAPMEMKWLRLDGRTLDVETVAVAIHRKGELQFQGFARDLTERKKTEAALTESARRLQALFHSALDAIFFIDASGRYVDANPAASALLGYSRDEILQKNVGAFTPRERKAEIAAIWQEVQNEGFSRGEFSVMHKDGTRRDIEYAAIGNVLPGLHSAFMHDITARTEAERSVRQLSARLLQLQDQERRRIALQLHDTTAQNLAALRISLSRIRRAADDAVRDAADECISLTEQSISEIRTLAYLLHPPMFDESGLLPSLRWYVKGFAERSGIDVAFDAPEELERLTPELETAVFRIVQEALTNIQRHSGSRIANIVLDTRPDALHLEISDEGRGLPEGLRGDSRRLAAAGVGVAGIQERVRELGGSTEIESGATGMTVRVTLPLRTDGRESLSQSDR